MDKNGVIGELLETGQNTTKNAVSDVTKSVRAQVGIPNKPKTQSAGDGFSDAIKNQMGISDPTPKTNADSFSETLQNQMGTSTQTQSSSNDDALSAIRDQLGLSAQENKPNQSSQNSTISDAVKNQLSQQKADAISQTENHEQTKEIVKEFYEPTDKGLVGRDASPVTPQEQLEKTREELKKFSELHKQVYYEPLISYETKAQQREETASERVEKQKMEDLEEQKKKEAKLAPIAVQRAQTKTEMNPGVAG